MKILPEKTVSSVGASTSTTTDAAAATATAAATAATKTVFIPTEIILQIVTRIDRSLRAQERQHTLYNICLVSHQWYSVALSFLYARPRLENGNAYRIFTDVLCPPTGLPRGISSRPKKNPSSKDLAGLVRRLDLSRLVHHSSNSTTARLIGRVRTGLEEFIAPASGFSVNCLSPLSKCTRIRYLDLALVHEPLSLESVVRAIRSMKRLVTFRCPGFMRITSEPFDKHSGAYPKWPPSIEMFQLSGTIEINMDQFHWPETMTHLCLKNCLNLSFEVMTHLLSNPQLSTQLKRLTISTYNRGLQPECIHIIPTLLPNLLFLSIPGDLVRTTFFSMIEHRTTHESPLALEVLELGRAHNGENPDFDVRLLMDLLHSKLPHLRAVGFHTMYGEYEDLDDALLDRAEEREGGEELRVSDEMAEFDVGTYYYD